jgi:hypothetical protein
MAKKKKKKKTASTTLSLRFATTHILFWRSARL